MNRAAVSHFARRCAVATLPAAALVAVMAGCSAAPGRASGPRTVGSGGAPDVSNVAERRRRFLAQELTTARPFGYFFNAGDTPRIVWRDVEEVRRLGADGRLRVRWFDADLNEAAGPPTRPGRWAAWVEGTAPNGTPLRRALTFYCRPPGFLFFGRPGALVSLLPPPAPAPPATQPDRTGQAPMGPTGPADPAVWEEREAELARAVNDLAFRALNDSEAGATLLAGLAEAQPLGRPPREVESLAVRNDDYHLALKLRVLGLAHRVRPLKPPRKRDGPPAPTLREGTPEQAGVGPDARVRIEAVCRAWAEDTGVPFVTLVARNGVIVTHAAFGRDESGRPVGLDYRCPVFSITKTVTGILFSQFVDQGLIGLDDRLSAVFPDYPRTGPNARRVPTFRQCFTHTSGLSGHGAYGGVRNPHLDNVVLNALDANEPGRKYEYSGTGFELAAEAMELVTGKSWRRVYEDHLFAPLALGDVPMTDASAGAAFTARELGVLGQWLANRGSYGEWEFVTPATFEKLLPEPVKRRWPDVEYGDDEGIGNHWVRTPRPGAPPGSTRPGDQLLGRRTIGHGALSGCLFRVDLDNGLVVVQARKQAGPRHAEWSVRFLQAVAEGLR